MYFVRPRPLPLTGWISIQIAAFGSVSTLPNNFNSKIISQCPWDRRLPRLARTRKIKMFWKWGHSWLWQMSPCRSSSWICHFIRVTPRGSFIHIGPNQPQSHVTIGSLRPPSIHWCNAADTRWQPSLISDSVTPVVDVRHDAGPPVDLLTCVGRFLPLQHEFQRARAHYGPFKFNICPISFDCPTLINESLRVLCFQITFGLWRKRRITNGIGPVCCPWSCRSFQCHKLRCPSTLQWMSSRSNVAWVSY